MYALPRLMLARDPFSSLWIIYVEVANRPLTSIGVLFGYLRHGVLIGHLTVPLRTPTVFVNQWL